MLELRVSHNQRKKRNNSKKCGSFVTDVSHHQLEEQDKWIHCNHKHDMVNCEN